MDMSRRLRIHFYGAIYHVMSRGVDGREIFADDEDRHRFLAEMERVRRDSGAEILAYCLMGNHFHLAIRVAHIPLSVIMHRLLTAYVQRFNRRHDRKGHLFQSRHHAKLCLDEAYLRTVIRYIHLNPVRAGLVERAHQWPWSSLRGIPMDDEGDDMSAFDPWAGGESIEWDLRREVAPRRESLGEIAGLVAGRAGISASNLKASSYEKAIIQAKRTFARAAVGAGHSVVQIAEWLGCPKGSASRYARAESETVTPDPVNSARTTAGRS